MLHSTVITRMKLERRSQLATVGILCAQSEPESMLVARMLLNLPKSIEGNVAECGCSIGGSTAKCGHVLSIVGRRLVVFDSFQGLPEEKTGNRYYNFIDKQEVRWPRVSAG